MSAEWSEVIFIFISQFIMITLVGLNQLNVVHNHLYMAMITSMLIGMCSFYNITKVSSAEAYSAVWWAFVIAGGIAIGFSMKLHPVLVKIFNRVDGDKDDTETEKPFFDSGNH